MTPHTSPPQPPPPSAGSANSFSSPRRKSARSLALRILNTIERDDCYADEAMHRASFGVELPPRERALMMELVYGVLRTRLRLDWRLELVADRRMNRLPITVANALRLGAYQVLHLTRVPHRAAVHETVELVRETVRGPRWPGFTNAVLRSLLRTAPPEPPPMSENAVRALSIRYACPPWLVERWVARLGIADAERACCAAAEPPPLTLRVNTARTTRAALLQALKDSGHMAVPTQVSPVGIQLQKCGSPSQLPGYQEGLFYVEDEAAQLIPMMLGPRSGERVLDACAAPGGKATHLTELLHGRAELVAVDWSADRVGVMHANMARLGTIGIHTLVFDWTKTAELQTGSLPPSCNNHSIGSCWMRPVAGSGFSADIPRASGRSNRHS